MDNKHWGKLLETCLRQQGTDLLFVPGSPPLVRTDADWRTFELPPLAPGDVKSMASEFLGGPNRKEADGYTYCHFPYRDTHFRLRAFNYPDTVLLVVSIIDLDAIGKSNI
jgi:Tfp pilus assembly pilus retraction ATPase PilT